MESIDAQLKRKFRRQDVPKIEKERAKVDYISESQDILKQMKDMMHIIEANKAKVLSEIEPLSANDKVILDDDGVIKGLDRDFVAQWVSLVGGLRIKYLGVTPAQIDYVLSFCYNALYNALHNLDKMLGKGVDDDNAEVKDNYKAMYGEQQIKGANITNDLNQISKAAAKAYEEPEQQMARKVISGLKGLFSA